MFKWDVEIFTEFQTATLSIQLRFVLYLYFKSLVLSGIAFFLVMSFFSYLNLKDTTIGTMAVFSAISSLVLMCFSLNGGIRF